MPRVDPAIVKYWLLLYHSLLHGTCWTNLVFGWNHAQHGPLSFSI
jgi:hypothetical protein